MQGSSYNKRFVHSWPDCLLMNSQTSPSSFKLLDIDPTVLRKRSRNALIIIVLMFVVIGMGTASLTLHLLKPYNDNTLVLNFIGAFIGLILTFALVKRFFAHQPWMQETMYLWDLKRQLMHIYNVLTAVKDAANNRDKKALKILRFYHLALTQMHEVEQNSHASIDLMAEKNALEAKLIEMAIPLDQTEFDPAWLTPYTRSLSPEE